MINRKKKIIKIEKRRQTVQKISIHLYIQKINIMKMMSFGIKQKIKINLLYYIMEHNLKKNLSVYSQKSFSEYREYLDNNLRLNNQSTIFFFTHIQNLLKLYSSELGGDKFFYIEKLFFYSLELRLFDIAFNLLSILKAEFGDEPKIKRLYANYLENYDNGDNLAKAVNIYKSLIKSNQEDKLTLRNYLSFMKMTYEIKDYIPLLNEYLSVYMDDIDAWYELSDIYIQNNNLNKAVYCLEEIIIHNPNNYRIYTKIGDILASFNNTDSAMNAMKYYSQSIIIKPSPGAFWGILYSINTVYKVNKSLDEKLKKLYILSKRNLENLYKDLKVDSFYDFNI
jgi:tetratricopeptide (TPR) repeat protein